MFVLPTQALEGFGLVILEALGCGTPVVGTPVGAIPDVLRHFDERWIAKGCSPAEIAAAVADSSATFPERALLAAATGADYSWGTVSKLLLKSVEPLAKNK